MEKNLEQREGLLKFKHLVEEIRIAMMITSLGKQEHARPMETIKVDNDGCLWFLLSRSSFASEELNHDHQVHLVYAHPAKDSYLDVRGNAIILDDEIFLKELIKQNTLKWIPEAGEETLLLKFTPSRAHYWDHTSNKLLGGISFIASLFTGQKLAEGEEGDIDLP